MNSIDDLPQRPSSHDTEEVAAIAFLAAIGASNYFLVQNKVPKDYGVDCWIEARNGEAMTNILAYIQLKGTEAPPNANDSISIVVERTNLNYLLRSADSMYVCYHLPSKRLLVRYAIDVYREYEHRSRDWQTQKKITVNFKSAFDEDFQRQLNQRLLALGGLNMKLRLETAVTPPEKLPALIDRKSEVLDVPAEPERAEALLRVLYSNGKETAISRSFELFNAVLGHETGAMEVAYLAEINLAMSGLPFCEELVRDAIRTLENSLHSERTSQPHILYNIGNGWLALREYNLAKQAYMESLAEYEPGVQDSVAAQCNHNLGSVFLALNENEKAREHYEAALLIDPDLAESHLDLALWFRNNRADFSTMLSHLDSITHSSRSAISGNVVNGWRIEALAMLGRTHEMHRDIQNLLAQSNKDEWIWPWCAKHVAQVGKSSVESAQKAATFWRAYTREHPELIPAKREYLLCLAYLHSSGSKTEVDYAEFKSELLQIIENEDPDPAFLWDRIGHWAQNDKNWAEAECCFRRAYELEPARYGYCLGTALNFLKRFEEALPILKYQAEEHLPDALSWFQVVIASEGVGDLDSSITAYQRALELDSEYDLAWFNLGGIFWNLGETIRATEIWQQAIARFPEHELAKKLRLQQPRIFRPLNR